MTQLKYYDTGSSSWVTAVVGAQGAQGSQGSQGAQGAQGSYAGQYVYVAAPTGDATTDTANINSAIASLSAGKVLVFSSSGYLTNGGHVINVPCMVLGTGRERYLASAGQPQTIRLATTATADLLTVTSPGVTIRDLSINGNFDNGTSGTLNGLVLTANTTANTASTITTSGGTLTVASTVGFPAAGTITILSGGVSNKVTYTSITPTSFICTSSTANFTSATNDPVSSPNAQYHYLENVWIENFGGNGLVINTSGTTGSRGQYSISGVMHNIETRTCGINGLLCSSVSDQQIDESMFDQNVTGVQLNGSSDVAFTNCHIWGNLTGVAMNASTTGCRIVNCFFDSNTGSSNLAVRGSGHVISGNMFFAGGNNGINCFQCNDLTITGNVLYNNNFKSNSGPTGAAIYLQGSYAVSTVGNVMYDTKGTKQQQYGYAEDVYCANNIFSGNVSRAAQQATAGGNWVIASAYTGTATSTTATSLTQSGAGFTPSAYIGNTITAGSSTGTITGNTATVITVAGGWTGGTPSSTASFTINGATTLPASPASYNQG
jgi:hypothetical protein